MTPEYFQGADGLKLRNLTKTCGSWIEVIFRVAEVGIHEAGEERASAQGFRESVLIRLADNFDLRSAAVSQTSRSA